MLQYGPHCSRIEKTSGAVGFGTYTKDHYPLQHLFCL